MKLKLFLLTVLTILGLSLPISSYAGALNLSIRLGQPKSPTNQDNIKLTFVALEVGGTSDILVGCYKKSSSDVDFVKFEEKTIIPGGNTDYCTINNSIFSSNGTYHFKVVANGIKESNLVTLDYNTSGPGTPNSYSKEWLNSCDYKIKFKTADDGETVKVELYRSDTKSISLDSGSRISTLNIGPNTEGEITNSIPMCGKEYYYAIRAVDSADNVSGVTGDSFTTTTTTTTTETAQGALLSGEGSQITEGTTSSDEATTPTEGTEATSTDSAIPEVLGAETTKYSYLKWILLAVASFAIFQLLTHKKRA